MITKNKTIGQYMGLNYEIGNTGTSYYYSIWDVGTITKEKIELACGSSCKNEFSQEYIENTIKEILEAL